MPGHNTDAQNNWLYATNILLNELTENHDSQVYRPVVRLRDELFDADGNFNYLSATDETPLADWELEIRDSFTRVELDDIYFTANARTNSTRSWVFFRDTDGDIRAYSSNHDTVRIPSEDHLTHWRNSYEEHSWPNRISQDDVTLIAENSWLDCTDVLIKYKIIYCSAANGDYDSNFDKDSYYSFRYSVERNRWPNRVPMKKILGWRVNGHNHVYLANGNGGDVFCNNLDKGKVDVNG